MSNRSSLRKFITVTHRQPFGTSLLFSHSPGKREMLAIRHFRKRTRAHHPGWNIGRPFRIRNMEAHRYPCGVFHGMRRHCTFPPHRFHRSSRYGEVDILRLGCCSRDYLRLCSRRRCRRLREERTLHVISIK